MELSQKELPIEKRFALVVRHNKWLMNKNLYLEEVKEYIRGFLISKGVIKK